MNCLSYVFESVVKDVGVDIYLWSEVIEVQVDKNKVCGLILIDSIFVKLKVVVLSFDFKWFVMMFFDWKDMEWGVLEQVWNYKFEGMFVKFNIVLDGLFKFLNFFQDLMVLGGVMNFVFNLFEIEVVYDVWWD